MSLSLTAFVFICYMLKLPVVLMKPTLEENFQCLWDMLFERSCFLIGTFAKICICYFCLARCTWKINSGFISKIIWEISSHCSKKCCEGEKILNVFSVSWILGAAGVGPLWWLQKNNQKVVEWNWVSCFCWCAAAFLNKAFCAKALSMPAEWGFEKLSWNVI